VEAIRQSLAGEGKLDEAAEKRLAARVERARVKLLGADKAAELKGPPPIKDSAAVEAILARARELAAAPKVVAEKWGLLGELGLNNTLNPLDEKTRTNATPYGFSGVMLGAALVFFAFIGFDSISTHAEEAVKPSRDVPIGILASLFICTLLYIGVSAVITGMVPYPDIDTKAAIASAFSDRAEVDSSPALHWSARLIALGGLAGMTSVLLITFLSQARIFLAMSRDGFLPRGVFGTVHPKFKTPHVSTIVTGLVIAAVAAFTPIGDLEKMVNIGTLFAFIVVCAAVMLLRIRRPEANRPFRCPALFVMAPLGILVNVAMMLFLPLVTWMRLVIWLAIGLVIYFGYGYWNSALGKGVGMTLVPAGSGGEGPAKEV
jgi:APA family basic amino acid/polyamine antiporter